MRAPVRSGYSLAELTVALKPYLGGRDRSQPESVVEVDEKSNGAPVDAGADPLCPKCGVPMVLRTAGRGERRGEQFYGCPNYPRCRETVAVVGVEA
jgi:predicted RNA-binding Zn-ribbon protein involved in translation (DUF1610 family)